jgi:hypothetical protein
VYFGKAKDRTMCVVVKHVRANGSLTASRIASSLCLPDVLAKLWQFGNMLVFSYSLFNMFPGWDGMAFSVVTSASMFLGTLDDAEIMSEDVAVSVAGGGWWWCKWWWWWWW